MTLNLSVADDQFARYMRRCLAIAERCGKSLDYNRVMSELQRIHDTPDDAGEVSAPASLLYILPIAPTPGGGFQDEAQSWSRGTWGDGTLMVAFDGKLTESLKRHYESTVEEVACVLEIRHICQRLKQITDIAGGETEARKDAWTPQQVLQHVRRQGSSDSGALTTSLESRRGNLFFMIGKKGRLVLTCLRRSRAHWNLYEVSPEYHYNDGTRLFLRQASS